MRNPQSNRIKLPPLATLPAFSIAARTGSLTLAARELHLTPGAISRQIRELESSIGRPLFERRHRDVILTDDGAALLATHTQAL